MLLYHLRGNDIDGKPQCFSEAGQQLRIAPSISAECMIVSDDDFSQPNSLDQNLPYEVLSLKLRELMGKGYDDEPIDPQRFNDVRTLLQRGQQWYVLPMHYFARVRTEAQDDAASPLHSRPIL